MDTSEFLDVQQSFPDAELLPVGGSTCDCYRVKLYGKLHFMKRLKPELRTDPRYVAALQKEFETGFRLDHPHLVHYVSKGDDYLLTEYVDGLTLGAFVAENPDYFKSVENTNHFLNQLLDVVGYLHQHQVVHLDLKPSNILITRIGQEIKLADLGFCYTDTYTDTMGRTDKYAAPEQLDGVSKVDITTDIYAIGKILEMLPLPSIYNKVKDRCLKKLPAKRFQSTEEIKTGLPSERRRWPWLILAILGIMLVGGLWLYQKPQSQIVPENSPTIIEDSLPKDTIKPANLEESSKPSISVDGRDVISNKDTENHQSNSDQLKTDIAAAVLPKFNATLGALPDSIRPGSEQWAEAGWALERELSNTLQELILSHQDIPMQTVAQEYNSYVQSLITLKFNQNSPQP